MNIVFPSRILIPIFHSFLPIFLQNLQWVLCYYNLLWGNWCVSLLFLFLPIPSLGVFGYQDWFLSLALSSLLSQKPQLEKVRRRWRKLGQWGMADFGKHIQWLSCWLLGFSQLLHSPPPCLPPSPRAPGFRHMAKALYFSSRNSPPFHSVHICPIHL